MIIFLMMFLKLPFVELGDLHPSCIGDEASVHPLDVIHSVLKEQAKWSVPQEFSYVGKDAIQGVDDTFRKRCCQASDDELVLPPKRVRLAGLKPKLQKSKSMLFRIPKSWGRWSSWSPCSVSCGHGVATRWRSCKGSACALDEREAQLKVCDFSSCDRQ